MTWTTAMSSTAWHVEKQTTLENAKDSVRHQLYRYDSCIFPYGLDGTDVQDLAHTLIESWNVTDAESLVICEQCSIVWWELGSRLSQIADMHSSVVYESINDFVKHRKRKILKEKCAECEQQLVITTYFTKNPHLFVVSLPNTKVHINNSLMLNVGDNALIFKLKSIVYYGSFHFNCLMFDSIFHCVFHNSMCIGSKIKGVGTI